LLLFVALVSAQNSPTPYPTNKQIVVDSQSYYKVSVTQTLNGISKDSFDADAAKSFKYAVATVLASYSVSDYDVTINSYSRRRLYEHNERELAGSMTISYLIWSGAQKAGYSDTSSAASAVINTLTAAVQSSVFNNAISKEAQDPYHGSSAMIGVTSSNTIDARDSTNDLADSFAEAYRAYVRAVATAVILSLFFFFLCMYITVFYAVHKRCPRPGMPTLKDLNPCSKDFEQASTTDTDAVEVTVVDKTDKTGKFYYLLII